MTDQATSRATIIFANGVAFHGNAYGTVGRWVGKVSIHTGATGYQEVITDPARAGEIIVMATPHIGNTGVNDADALAATPQIGGLVVRDPARTVSNFRAERPLTTDLEQGGVVGISGVDTRAITRFVRDNPELRAGIFSGPDADLDESDMIALVTSSSATTN